MQTLTQNESANIQIGIDLLKLYFNITLRWGPFGDGQDPPGPTEIANITKALQYFNVLLENKKFGDLVGDVVNCLINTPDQLLKVVGEDVKSVETLYAHLEAQAKIQANPHEALVPILTLLKQLVKNVKPAKQQIKQKLLPEIDPNTVSLTIE